MDSVELHGLTKVSVCYYHVIVVSIFYYVLLSCI